MRPSQTFHVLETVRKSSLPLLRRNGVELSSKDSQTVLDVYQQWLALMCDLGYLHPETLLRTATRLWADLVQADVLVLNNAFAECLHLVRTQTNKGFKALCSQVSSHLHHIVVDDMNRCLVGDVRSAKRLVQLFSYTSRLTLSDIDLTQQMLEDYMATEDRLSPIDPRLDPLLHDLNVIIRKWMLSFDPSRVYPNHGPGGVAGLGRCSLEVKYKDLTSDQLLTYAFGEPWWVLSPIRSILDRISHTIFVPKSYKTFRTISMEPTTLQYFQQGVWREIERVTERSSYLRSHFGFRDSSRNCSLAKEGSLNRNYATLDLSSASDSVSYELVKKLFRGTKLLRFIVATRSTRTLLPDGRIIELKKFAPMGSSLCFPVETIIFASICEHVTRVLGTPGRYSVYGDDIIVPTHCVESVVRILERLQFRVNREKSFSDQACWFRESCGGEFCDGYDVTPMRVSRKYSNEEDDVRYDKLVSLANTAYKRRFLVLRYFFVAKLREDGYLPFFSPTSLLSDNYTNYHTGKRWSDRYQRVEVLADMASATIRDFDREKQDEVIRYHHWLAMTRDRKAVFEACESVVCRSTKVISRQWRAKPYEDSDYVFLQGPRADVDVTYPHMAIMERSNSN